MESKNELESGFRIQNILLMEQTFNRISKVSFDNPEKIRHNVNVDVGVHVEGTKVLVTEKVDVVQEYDGKSEYSISVTMLGMFDFIGNSKLTLENFGAVNGAAIVFPYIREIITSTCARAGLGLVFIPPFDFTKQKAKIQTVKS